MRSLRTSWAGLTQVQIFPQFAAFNRPDTAQAQFAHSAIVSSLNPQETQEWHAAVAQAVADRTYFIVQPFHCALGTKLKSVR
jgi:hypothetical protein